MSVRLSVVRTVEVIEYRVEMYAKYILPFACQIEQLIYIVNLAVTLYILHGSEKCTEKCTEDLGTRQHSAVTSTTSCIGVL